MARTALIIEDDPDIARLVQVHLRDIHCRADIAREGQQALALSSMHTYDLIVLDLMLPDMDGLEVCKHLREREDYLPILMLTSKSTELDRVLGLEMGADDYLTKPFSIAELLARIKALFRRAEALSQNRSIPQTCETITHGDLVIEVEKHLARVGNVDLDLTAREFDLLLHFARYPGRVFSRAQLLDLVWGYAHEGYEHTVNSHINRLRAKLETDPASPRYILTVWGVGYRFAGD